MRTVMRAFAPLLLCASVIAACSSSSSPESSVPPPPAPPEWVDRPADAVKADEGHAFAIPVTVRAADVAKLSVTATGEHVTTELVAEESETPNDGLWHGKLRIEVEYGGAKDAALHVALDDGIGHVVDVPVKISARALAWRKRIAWDKTNGPPTREHGVFVLDEKAQLAFLFQGSGYDPQWVPLGDAWRLDMKTGAWSAWTPTGDVPTTPRAAHRVAVVPGTTTAYVYGGYTGFEKTEKSLADLYRLDVANATKSFTKLENVGSPPPRQLHALAYDAKGEQLVVFGGFTDQPRQDALDDTWLVKVKGDTATWTQVEDPKGPSARYGSFTAFDAESRRFFVWSGGQYPESDKDPVNAAQDAWALDVSVDPPKWSKLTPTGAAPKGRRNGCAMHDPIGRRLFVYGGTSDGKTTEPGLWVLDLEKGREQWRSLTLADAPPMRSSGFGFATANGDVVCAFGNGAAVYSDVNVLGYAPRD